MVSLLPRYVKCVVLTALFICFPSEPASRCVPKRPLCLPVTAAYAVKFPAEILTDVIPATSLAFKYSCESLLRLQINQQQLT